MVNRQSNFETSDLILINPALTPKDREFMKLFFQKNREKYEKKKKETIFSSVEDKDFIDTIDKAMKAILQHNINKMQGGY